MSWKVRHEGSPRSIDDLTIGQVAEGLQEGHWEATDEVMGPGEGAWVALEKHPQFADLVADLEPPSPRLEEDEARLDMNPLIDVTMVLLIFFILTTSYAALQQVLDMPKSGDDKKGPPVVRKDVVDQTMIRVLARQENGQPVILVDDERVDLPNLEAVLTNKVRATKKRELLYKGEGVSWGVTVAVQDAATGAGIEKINRQLTKEQAQK